MRSVRLLTMVLLTLGLHASAQQTTASSDKKSDLTVEAKLVVVPAVVRDKHDALVSTFKQGDFALTVDGKPQVIRYFDHESDVPLTLGLLVDTSMSQRTVLDDERTASSAFLDKMLAPERDKAFVVQFARQVELLQDVTDSKPQLQQAIKEIDTASPSFTPSSNDDGDRASRGGTALYDSIFLSADEITAKQKGRRALVLLTDGVDRNSKESLASAIESAQRADTIIYAIYYKGTEPQHERTNNPGGHHGGGGYPGGGGGWPGGGGGWPGGGGQRGGQPGGGQGGNYPSHIDGKQVLERICGETGGSVFEVSKKETVEVVYGHIAEELRAQYRLGFTPTTEAAQDGYHRIDLELTGSAKDKNYIQTREGYYAGAAK